MEDLTLEYREDLIECGICQEVTDKNDIYVTGCNHLFCMTCFTRLLHESHIRCPLCRKDVHTFTFRGRKNRVYTLPEPSETLPTDPLEPDTRMTPQPNVTPPPTSSQGPRLLPYLGMGLLTLGNLIWWIVYRALFHRYETCQQSLK